MNMTRRGFATSALAALASSNALAAPQYPITGCTKHYPTLTQAMMRLKMVYPGFIGAASERVVLWKDGSEMAVSLFPTERPVSEKIRNPDLASQVLQAYPQGTCSMPTDPDTDPGRIRYAPFFAKMYGADHAAVAANIVRVSWPSIARAPFVQVTKINDVAGRLTRIASDLAALPKRFHTYFDNPAGGFNARPIAGTQRPSAHAFGIAVDINTNHSDYWRDEIKDESGEPTNWKPKAVPKNRIPFEIVEIFERQGFIWGGKWYHYDTMHFEYRPELLL